MDERLSQETERLFHKKIMLYNDLLHCLNRETEALIDIDMDKLWNISMEKNEICSKIKSLREEIISTLFDQTLDRDAFKLTQVLDLIPGEQRSKFQELYRTLIKLKSEVEALREENMTYIDDSLHFLDEMISIITGETKSQVMYNDRCHLSQTGTSFHLLREA